MLNLMNVLNGLKRCFPKFERIISFLERGFMKKNCLLLLAIIIWSSPVVMAQNSLDTLALSISNHLSGYPSELVYLQTSKDIYETGEDLWFKIYQLDAQSLALSDQSKTLYLQMVNDKDSVVWHEKYAIEGGIAKGHVYIDEKLSEGNYFLETYTRNSYYRDTTGILLGKKIRIVKNITHNNQQEDIEDLSGFKFDVYPEGGNLVSNLRSTLAFKATHGKDYPVDVEGILYEDEEMLTTFKSSHDGMGIISFTPFAGKKYRIELMNGNSYSLPEIYKQGMTLRLTKQDRENLEFILSQSEGLPEQEIYLLGQIRGMVCCVAKGMLKDYLKVKIPTSEFPYQGIAEFTLFDSTMQPIAERLVYVHAEKKLRISIKPEKDKYVLREKVTLKIKVTDEEDKPVKTHLGISVFDKAYSNPANILTHCYLTSQIRGTIHNPVYYFDEANKDRMNAMDLLLLTQGWRRYLWNTNSPKYRGEIFLTDEITGVQRIENKKKNKETESSEQLIQVSGSEGNPVFIMTDSAGNFITGTNIMKDLQGGYLYLKPMLSKEYKPVLEIKDYFPLIDSIRKNKSSYFPVMHLSETVKKQTLDLPVVSSDSTILLSEVVVTSKAHKPFRDKFMGHLDSLAQINLSHGWVCECKNDHPFLNDYLPGYTHHIYHTASYSGKRLAPVNGVTYMLIKYVMTDNGVFVGDIKNVTYNGQEFTDEELLRMNNLWRTKGYYGNREFYQPDEIDIQLSMPDARNTLLWQPAVITDEKGDATVSFFCSDINTGFVGVVEGTDGAGLLGTGNCEFRVIRNID